MYKKVSFFWGLMILLLTANAQEENKYPYSTNTQNLTIWNGTEYVPFFIKGVNLGVSVPGTFPGQLAATKSDYIRWISDIKEAGFNCIRLYTLHYPQFFEVLDSMNRQTPNNPLLFLQGVWLEEELAGYDHDLHFLSTKFRQEIEDNINCVHGNNVIAHRFGKAHGTYTKDLSKWCLGYIVGREIYPDEVVTTNNNHVNDTTFTGNHFSISSGSPAEKWVTSMLDYAVSYEHTNYNTQRPVCSSSWPTLDPIKHKEVKFPDEDLVSLDLSKIQLDNAPAGLFISYHAYPYYPDFISDQPDYQGFSDDYGKNSYIGYLTELKSHYKNFPLIIAEYGVPSSWAVAHYTSSGMNHGGYDELNQGITNVRLLDNMRTTMCGGGIQFAWLDEWFKRTWVTDQIDYSPEDRILWHNIAAAEQNFGLIAFDNAIETDTLVKFSSNDNIKYIKTEVNYAFFEIEIGLKKQLDIIDTMWVSIDTYGDTLGESILPSGAVSPLRSEFALQLSNSSASLYVTEAYDIFGIWHGIVEPEQKYHSTKTDGAPWNLVRVKNNASQEDVQFIGELKVNHSFQPDNSEDGVRISNDKILIRLPWFYLNFVGPNGLKVFSDDRSTPEKEIEITEGIGLAVNYKNEWFSSPQRFKWNSWHNVKDYAKYERKKTSYYVMKEQLVLFNTPAVAYADSVVMDGPDFPVTVNALNGVLKNDFDIDGNKLISLLAEDAQNGKIDLNNDGSYTYQPDPYFIGVDTVYYYAYDGQTLSTPNKLLLNVLKNSTVGDVGFAGTKELLSFYPNPSDLFVEIESHNTIGLIQVFDYAGNLIDSQEVNGYSYTLDVSSYDIGSYVLVASVGGETVSKKIVKI